MPIIRFRVKIIFEKSCKFFVEFLLNFDKNDFYAKSFGGFWKLVFCVHMYTCSFYKSVVSDPFRSRRDFSRSAKVSSVDSAFSAIDFEKSLKNIFTQFFDIFANFCENFFESKISKNRKKSRVRWRFYNCCWFGPRSKSLKIDLKVSKIMKFR